MIRNTTLHSTIYCYYCCYWWRMITVSLQLVVRLQREVGNQCKYRGKCDAILLSQRTDHEWSICWRRKCNRSLQLYYSSGGGGGSTRLVGERAGSLHTHTQTGESDTHRYQRREMQESRLRTQRAGIHSALEQRTGQRKYWLRSKSSC